MKERERGRERIRKIGNYKKERIRNKQKRKIKAKIRTKRTEE